MRGSGHDLVRGELVRGLARRGIARSHGPPEMVDCRFTGADGGLKSLFWAIGEVSGRKVIKDPG